MNILSFNKCVLFTLLSFFSLVANAQAPILDISFDGDAIDNSPNRAKIQGAIRFGTDRFGEFGKSAIFHPNHFDDLIVAPGLANIQITGPISFSVWVNAPINGTTRYVFTSSDSARVHAGFSLLLDSQGRPTVQLGDGYGGSAPNRNTYTAAGIVPSNEWTNVIVTIEQGRGPSIFIDGLPQTIGAPAGGNVSNTIRHNIAPFKIGQKWEHFYVGGIDDLKLYDRILTIQEITDLANNVSSTRTTSTSLISVYPTTTRDFLTVDMDGQLLTDQLSIINTTGQQFPVTLIGNATLNVSALPAGQYFLSCSTQEGSLVGQFTKL